MIGHVGMQVQPDIRKKFFTAGMVQHWNRLPNEDVGAHCLSVFKRHLLSAFNHML